MRPHARRVLFALALISVCRPAAAVTVDGTLEPAYGTALTQQAVQTNSTGFAQISGDNNQGNLDFANGSELDLGYAFVADGKLNLFLAGNLALMLNAQQNGTVRHVLDVFVDAVPGGQQMLNGLGAGVVVNGLTFDSGFEADYWFELEGDDNGFLGPREWTARYAALQNGGGGTLVTLGRTSAGGPGTLMGGTNPHGVLASIDNRNTGGVSAGCNASSGAGVMNGVEWAIPLAAIGNPSGCLRIIAFTRSGASLSNQVLAPVPAGTCPLGTASTVNFAGIAGDQSFSICPTTGVTGPGSARLALMILGPSPLRGAELRVTLTLPDARAARLQVVDAAGRMIREHGLEGRDGTFEVNLSDHRPLVPGVYWIRLVQGAAAVTRQISVVR
jgi:hypothetical protein